MRGLPARRATCATWQSAEISSSLLYREADPAAGRREPIARRAAAGRKRHRRTSSDRRTSRAQRMAIRCRRAPGRRNVLVRDAGRISRGRDHGIGANRARRPRLDVVARVQEREPLRRRGRQSSSSHLASRLRCRPRPVTGGVPAARPRLGLPGGSSPGSGPPVTFCVPREVGRVRPRKTPGGARCVSPQPRPERVQRRISSGHHRQVRGLGRGLWQRPPPVRCAGGRRSSCAASGVQVVAGSRSATCRPALGRVPIRAAGHADGRASRCRPWPRAADGGCARSCPAAASSAARVGHMHAGGRLTHGSLATAGRGTPSRRPRPLPSRQKGPRGADFVASVMWASLQGSDRRWLRLRATAPASRPGTRPVSIPPRCRASGG